MFFEVTHTSRRSRARRGVLVTHHGTVQTPAFVPVGTKGTIKSIDPLNLSKLGVQIAFVNTYHLSLSPGTEIIHAAGGIHAYSHLSVPLMSDSAGFQVFSLAAKKRAHVHNAEEDPLVLSIHENGVNFRSVYDGSTIDFTPETSMQFQYQIGADLIMAFDECTPQGMSYEYAKTSMERTHYWLERSKVALGALHKEKSLGYDQYLYGIIQGAGFEDLRVASAQFIESMNTPGIAIGGIAVGETKEEIRNQVRYIAPYLPDEKPVHLLGVGYIEDIVDLVTFGIDTFDCVEPTRMAREGRILIKQKVDKKIEQNNGQRDYVMNILDSVYKYDLSPVDETAPDSPLYGYSKSYLHHLFKQRELFAYTLTTEHNLYVMNTFMQQLRTAIEHDII